MFGIGPSEMVVIALLFLLVFGPSKMPQMARDIGKFVGQARGAIDEFKEELTAEDQDDKPARKRKSEHDKSQRDSDPRSSGNEEDPEPDPEDSRRERAEYDL